MKAVLDNLGKPDIRLSGRNMGTKGAIALSHALKVRIMALLIGS